MLTYIINNQSGGRDAYGNTFEVALTGKSTRTVMTAQISAARVRLQEGAKSTATKEHLLMHSRALTSSGNTRFHHIVGGSRQNSHIVATLRKTLSNNGQYDQFELANTHRLTLKHPLHRLDFYFTDNSGNPVPIGQGDDVTETVWQQDANFVDTYKEDLNLTYDSTGTIELVVDNVNYTWAETTSTSGTITGPTNSTWTRVGNEYTILWGGNSATWYKNEVNSSNKKQLLATQDYNDIHSPGTLIWEKEGNFASPVSVTFTDDYDGTGSAGSLAWAFSTVTGFVTFTGTYTTVLEPFLATDKIHFKIDSSDDPQYSSVANGTVIYSEDVTTTYAEPVSSSQVTTPLNGFTGEDLSIHVELNCLHRGT
jgi:hypothetical protein